MSLALVNGRVLREQGFVEGECVLIEDGRIAALLGRDDPRCRAAQRYDLRGGLLLPGFIDSQVNGGGGVLFNDSPSVAAIRTIGRAHRRFGTTGFLPTLISADLDIVARAIDAVHGAIDAGVPGCSAFTSRGRSSTSPARACTIRRSCASSIRARVGIAQLAARRAHAGDAGAGDDHAADDPAPGGRGRGGFRRAHQRDLRGDSQPRCEHGLTGFTHLFNAMSQLTGREPGTVGAALDDPDSWCGIIVDGEHTDPVVLRIALQVQAARSLHAGDGCHAERRHRAGLVRAAGTAHHGQRPCLPRRGRTAGGLQHRHGELRAQRRRHARPAAGRGGAHGERSAGAVPRARRTRSGRIAPGLRANLVLTDDELNVLETWIDGRPSAEEPQPLRIRRLKAARAVGEHQRVAHAPLRPAAESGVVSWITRASSISSIDHGSSMVKRTPALPCASNTRVSPPRTAWRRDQHHGDEIHTVAVRPLGRRAADAIGGVDAELVRLDVPAADRLQLRKQLTERAEQLPPGRRATHLRRRSARTSARGRRAARCRRSAASAAAAAPVRARPRRGV